MDFIQNLTKLIEMRGITVNKLLKDLHMGKGTFATWKKRGTIPNGKTLQKIADYFGVTTDYLLTGSDNKKNSGINPEDEYQFALLDGAKELTDEGKKELINYLEYLKNKYKK